MKYIFKKNVLIYKVNFPAGSSSTNRNMSCQKKSAMAQLFGKTFAPKDMGSKAFADTIKEEVASYVAASGIPVNGDPLT